MPADSVGKILAETVRKARQFALSCDYVTALKFYDGLGGQLENHIQDLESVRDPMGLKWRLLRTSLDKEAEQIRAIQHELEALANAAYATRLDRGGGGGGTGDASPDGRANPYAVPRGGAQGAASQFPTQPQPQQQQHLRAPFRTEFDDDDDNAARAFAQHQEGVSRARGLRAAAAYEDAPVGRAPPKRGNGRPALGNINEELYGDKDRFGPGFTPPSDDCGVGMGFGIPPAVPKRNVNGGAKPVRQSPATGAGVPPPVGAGAGAAKGGDKARKPGLPKFGKKDEPAPAGVGGGAAAAAKKRAPYQPRPGDEELAAAISGEMTDAVAIGIKFDDIAGQQEAKDALQEAVIYPAIMPEYYQGILRPPKGVLLYGPPGTGKSMLAKAVAGMGQTTFFNVSTATLTSRMRGDSEKLVRILFEMARHYSPAVIFIDEIDSMCGQRGSDQHEASRRTLSVILAQMDGVGVDTSKFVMVLGATNHPWDIDEAMRRRFEKRIYIPLPVHEERVALFHILTRDVKLDDDVDFEVLSREFERMNYSGADLAVLTREAASMVMRNYLANPANREEIAKDRAKVVERIKELPVLMEYFRQAQRKTPTSVDMKIVEKFEQWKRQFEG
jgi:katanin p60 ATPase-containing subunit A1